MLDQLALEQVIAVLLVELQDKGRPAEPGDYNTSSRCAAAR
jgi:hypothetical protein